ncbi:MAG: tetratricopeptide repeat protein [Pseudomonadota bacterium]
MQREKNTAVTEQRLRRAMGLTLLIVVVIGASIGVLPEHARRTAQRVDPRRDPAAHADLARRVEIEQRFQQGVMMLHARQYDHAVTALHRVLELDPQLTEAHVNMGYALLGLERFEAARSFFESATALRPMQANAYYGMALAYEGLHDRVAAIGAMRTYVHLARADDPFVAKAKTLLLEWERGGKGSVGNANPN